MSPGGRARAGNLIRDTACMPGGACLSEALQPIEAFEGVFECGPKPRNLLNQAC
jgi:hypothetical protein